MADSSGESGREKQPDELPAPHFIPPQQGRAASVKQACRLIALYVRFCLSEEEAFGTRFLLLPFFLGIGIIAYFTLPFEPDWSELCALSLLAAGLYYWARPRHFWQLVFSFMLAACIGALCAKGETARCATFMVENNGFTFIKAQLIALERQEKGNYRLIVTVLSTQKPVLKKMPQRLRLLARQLPEGIKLGDGLEGLVFLRSFSGPIRPDSYDFAFQNYFRGISGQGNFTGMPSLLVLPPPGLMERTALKLATLRSLMTKRIREAISGEAGAVAAALITGERAGIAPATHKALRLSGLAHILSISGLHMAMVAGMVLLACRWILGLFPVFSSHYPPKKLAAFIALFIAGFYLALSGADISARRSFIMVAVMLGAILCDRAAISLRNLAISACLIMLCWPHEIMGPSFQMSFAATAALISAFGSWSVYRRKKREQAELEAAGRGLPRQYYRPLPKMRAHIQARLLAPLVSTCLASLVAGAAGGIYSAYHFNNTAPYGILGNILALPVMSVLVMPFALLGTLLMPLHLEAGPFHIMGIGIMAVEKAAYWVAGFSPDGNPGFISPLCLAFLSAGMVLLMFLRTGLRFFACLFIAIGCYLYAVTPLPLALIAENGRLAAVFNADKSLSLNTDRPSHFIVRNWQTGFAAGAALPPENAGQNKQDSGRFSCQNSVCRARLRNGRSLAIADEAEGAARALREGDIIVLNFMMRDAQEAALHAKAARSGKIVISQRDLALFGAAEIRESSPWLFGAKRKEVILWAAGKPARPWNSYRRFSRRAQGMPS